MISNQNNFEKGRKNDKARVREERSAQELAKMARSESRSQKRMYRETN